MTRGTMKNRFFVANIITRAKRWPPPMLWLWLMVVAAVLFSGTVVWIQEHQQNLNSHFTAEQALLRNARIDLYQGYLHTALADSPQSSFDHNQGLALLDQAVTNLTQALQRQQEFVNPIDTQDAITVHAALTAYTQAMLQFRHLLTDRKQEPPIQPAYHTELYRAFSALTQQADALDALIQHKLSQKLQRYSRCYTLTLWAAGAGLGFICLMIYAENRARQKAEDALRESEQRFRDIADISADWIWEVDVNTRYTYASDSVQALLGYTQEEILGKTPFEFMPPDEAEKLKRQFADICARHQPFRNLININRHKDGSFRHVKTEGVPILNAKGQLLGYRGLDRDITEQKQAELLIRKSEAFKHAILDSVSVEIVVLNGQGDIIAVNRPWRRFAEENGRGHQTEVGVNYLDICRRSKGSSSEGAHDAYNGIVAVLTGRQPTFSLEYPCHSPTQQRWFSMTATPLVDGDGDSCAVITHIDITRRKLAEEAQRQQTAELAQRNEELERFNRAMIGRELDMIALKQKINELSRQLGQEPPYPSNADIPKLNDE